jgi:hypothetical protein
MLTNAPSDGHFPSVVPVSRDDELCQSSQDLPQMVRAPEPE